MFTKLSAGCASTRAAISAFLLSTAMMVAPAFAAGNDAIMAANDGFYAALNTMFTGDAGPMLAVWSHEDDVTFMGPTGDYNRGWDAVHKNWETQAALKLGGKIEPTEISVIAGEHVAVVSNYEEGENTNADGKVAKVKLRATNIFRKEDGVWKMVGHHTDTLPFLAK
ncbi:MAG: nuclear transport factor 2 family protein [Parvibaculum sp.]|nr:nuclear transport factor 2 family protein [Parvibaculum sp.]